MRHALAVVLVIVEPASLALAASGSLPGLRDRGWPALTFLVYRLAATGLGLVAGVALWQGRPAGVPLARVALLAMLLGALVAASTPLWPGRAPPGLAGPLLALVAAWYAGWLWATTRIDTGTKPTKLTKDTIL